ncbi:unnamed protein product [Meganyctiphanes norvegica]|uniref:Fibronectin type-III domain-containing protein n=1 Tax=Meganyctiphanes norvegica TaxID=48144 RepID=A0AAV2R1V0_MEGNR
MEITIAITICVMYIGVGARPNDDNEAKFKTLREPECRPVELLVELPIAQETYYKLSSRHAYVRRCIGINNEKQACLPKDQVMKIEHWSVVKAKGSQKNEFIRVSWVSHEECEYQRRTKTNCSIDEARDCHEKSTTHYYDEANCKCNCIVQIDGEETCHTRAAIERSLSTDHRIDELENKLDSVTNELKTTKSEYKAIKGELNKLKSAMTSRSVVEHHRTAQLQSNTNIQRKGTARQHTEYVGCLTSRGKPGRCVSAVPCKALFHEHETLSVREFIATHNGGCPSRSLEEQSVCCPLHSHPLVEESNKPKIEWPLPGPVTNLIIESRTSSLFLRWDDPLTLRFGEIIDEFRVIWLSKGEIIKNRVVEASELLSPQRQLTIQDLRPDTEYTVAVEAKIKSEEDFSIPTVRKVKTLQRNT